MRILYYSPSSYGGLADYSHEQANALAQMGITVDFLCTPNYPTNKKHNYNILARLKAPEPKRPIKTKIGRAYRYVHVNLTNYRILSEIIKQGAYKHVLMGAYAEYLAPLWAWSLRLLANQGVIFGTIVHDPIRDFVLGPKWWHNWSVSQAYSFIRDVFVHEPVGTSYGKQAECIKPTVIPHGLYAFPKAERSRLSIRQELEIPESAKVILSFGHIRDGKNLDLIIQAMTALPEVYLLVAGKEQSSGQKDALYYHSLAKKLNVAKRCRWQVSFISEQDAANLFNASDLVALTYSRAFRSASGVLSVAANYQRQCIASGGEGSLKTVVQKYYLGSWIEPDSWEAIRDGVKQQLRNPPTPRWEEYYADNSWATNAQRVVETFKAH